jgi:hypothetical protein
MRSHFSAYTVNKMSKFAFEDFNPLIQQAVLEARQKISEKIAINDWSNERAALTAQLTEIIAILDRSLGILYT